MNWHGPNNTSAYEVLDGDGNPMGLVVTKTSSGLRVDAEPAPSPPLVETKHHIPKIFVNNKRLIEGVDYEIRGNRANLKLPSTDPQMPET